MAHLGHRLTWSNNDYEFKVLPMEVTGTDSYIKTRGEEVGRQAP